MNITSVVIATAVVAALGALIDQVESKETTHRMGPGGAKVVTVHKPGQALDSTHFKRVEPLQ